MDKNFRSNAMKRKEIQTEEQRREDFKVLSQINRVLYDSLQEVYDVSRLVEFMESTNNAEMLDNFESSTRTMLMVNIRGSLERIVHTINMDFVYSLMRDIHTSRITLNIFKTIAKYNYVHASVSMGHGFLSSNISEFMQSYIHMEERILLEDRNV